MTINFYLQCKYKFAKFIASEFEKFLCGLGSLRETIWFPSRVAGATSKELRVSDGRETVSAPGPKDRWSDE
ncbi:hypothetical protein ES707_00448 [subsurface metagenome]